MILKNEFVRKSLNLNLFFLRIMKEHSIFLEASLPSKNKMLIFQAEALKNIFTGLLQRAVSLSKEFVNPNLLQPNEFVTMHTLHAEKVTEFLSGITIDTRITSIENSLLSDRNDKDISQITDYVYMLNNHSMAAVNSIIKYKKKIKNDVLSCRLYTHVYPSLLEHVIEEAVYYFKLLSDLQEGIDINMKKDLINNQVFWNDIMSEHSFFIRGMLDPEEKELFELADKFGKEFSNLETEAESSKQGPHLSKLTSKTLDTAVRLRDFKEQGIIGILNCKIKSVIIPLLSDHVLREANHYINILESEN